MPLINTGINIKISSISRSRSTSPPRLFNTYLSYLIK
jgi:hypothetical protein